LHSAELPEKRRSRPCPGAWLESSMLNEAST
jgi:hypothetical protein